MNKHTVVIIVGRLNTFINWLFTLWQKWPVLKHYLRIISNLLCRSEDNLARWYKAPRPFPIILWSIFVHIWSQPTFISQISCAACHVLRVSIQQLLHHSIWPFVFFLIGKYYLETSTSKLNFWFLNYMLIQED